ncbi:MAG: rRNA ((1498)-N(3))-methyltransferase [Segetibacter sp.]|nr:rRNA ((1498)-N(3))-methyltransferase [Segetibacter sp.]
MKDLTKHRHFKFEHYLHFLYTNPGLPGFPFYIYSMALPVFFEENITNTKLLTLSEETSKHVVQVLRMKNGESLQLTDGNGNISTAKIVDDHKKKCTVSIIDQQFTPQKEQKISIAIGLVKNSSRLEWFLEKATEIGVTEIIPLVTDRTEKQNFRHDRMQQILIAAMIQSQQAWLPKLHAPITFEKVLTSSYEQKLIAHCEENRKQNITDFRLSTSVQILIGPEGDFTPHEIGLALQHNYTPVTLGNTRLRTETAGVVAATILCI